MQFQLQGGETVDTTTQCSFEERNLLQKMVIFSHLGLDRHSFRDRWMSQAAKVWGAAPDLANPTPAVRVLLDMEKGLPQG